MYKGSFSLSPSHTLPNPAGEKLCRLQSPWFGGVPLGQPQMCAILEQREDSRG